MNIHRLSQNIKSNEHSQIISKYEVKWTFTDYLKIWSQMNVHRLSQNMKSNEHSQIISKYKVKWTFTDYLKIWSQMKVHRLSQNMKSNEHSQIISKEPPGPQHTNCTTVQLYNCTTQLRLAFSCRRYEDRIPVEPTPRAPVQTGPGTHPASCTMDTGSFPGVKCGRGVLLTAHPFLVPRSWKSRAIPLPNHVLFPWADRSYKPTLTQILDPILPFEKWNFCGREMWMRRLWGEEESLVSEPPRLSPLVLPIILMWRKRRNCEKSGVG